MKKIKLYIVSLALAVMSFSTPVTAASIIEPSTSTTATTPSDKEVNNALNEFKSLSRKEKKSRVKEVKKLLKQYRADKKAGKETDDRTILLAILAIILPPLAIYLKEETFTWKFWVSLLLVVPIFFAFWYFFILAIGLALLVVFEVI